MLGFELWPSIIRTRCKHAVCGLAAAAKTVLITTVISLLLVESVYRLQMVVTVYVMLGRHFMIFFISLSLRPC